MLSRTLRLSAWFPVLLVAPLVAQRANPVERQLIAAGLWAEARYNYAYWDAVRANWDSAFAATVTATQARPAPTDLQFFRRLRRWGALLNDGQLEILPPSSIANRIARPPLELRSIERRPFIMDYAVNDEMRVARPERLAEVLAVQGVPWRSGSATPCCRKSRPRTMRAAGSGRSPGCWKASAAPRCLSCCASLVAPSAARASRVACHWRRAGRWSLTPSKSIRCPTARSGSG